MKPGTIVTASFIISMLSSLAGAFLKMTHRPGAEPLLIAAIITSLTFIISAIYEVRTSPRIDRSEKTMWTIGFILCSGITGLIYFIIARRRIA